MDAGGRHGLCRHAMHVPRILRQQLLCGLTAQFLNQEAAVASEQEFSSLSEAKPSIHRFHGALLFVDISGFTALSTKLDVETLKNHINKYFTQMLDIVEKHDGDVVKFAGDALYIVWPTIVSDEDYDGDTSLRHSASMFNSAAKASLEKAVICALEISKTCGNYEINLRGDAVAAPKMLRFMTSFSNIFGGGKVSPNNGEGDNDSIVHLNVHSGISCGLMAGVDVAHNGRAEFFIVGRPLTGVAMAESQAGKGDVVIDVAAHELLHGDNDGAAIKRHLGEISSRSNASHFSILGKFSPGSAKLHRASFNVKPHTYTCDCVRTPGGLYCLSSRMDVSTSSRPPMIHKAPPLQKAQSFSVLPDNNPRLQRENDDDIETIFASSKYLFRRKIRAIIERTRSSNEAETGPATNLTEHQLSAWINTKLRSHFSQWVLLEERRFVALHVHDCAREPIVGDEANASGGGTGPGSPEAMSPGRGKSLDELVLDCRMALLSKTLSHLGEAATPLSPVPMTADVDSMDPSLDDSAGLKITFKSSTKGSTASLPPVAQVMDGSEIRSVLVMFIKIEHIDASLLVERKGAQGVRIEQFAFLARSPSEVQADELVLSRFQRCYSVLAQAFHGHGGQMRQFIVDDKGTVCIGTFGLRGSAAMDNAATAVHATKSIVDGLRAIGLTASIGITSGTAYCGLVGSATRHEYAVMGPSTNLSARLMCKAPPNGVICDGDTVSRDRTHKFRFIAEVAAKGYSQPVATYSPEFGHSDSDVNEPSGRLVSKGRKTEMLLLRTVSKLGIQQAAQEASELLATMDHCLTATQRLTKLACTDFFISELATKAAQVEKRNSMMPQKLYGRQKELEIIFLAVFSDHPETPQLTRFDAPVKMIALCGMTGIGKSAILSALERKIQNAKNTDDSWNIIELRSRAASLQRGLPLQVWCTVLHKLFLAAHRSLALESKASYRTIQAPGGNLAKVSNFMALVSVVETHLPTELLKGAKPLLQLMCATQSAEQWQQVPAEDRTDEVLESCVRLVASLFTAIAALTKCALVMLLDDLQVFDSWSLRALHEVWKSSLGVAIVAAVDTTELTQESSTQSRREGSSGRRDTPNGGEGGEGSSDDPLVPFFAQYQDADRFARLELGPLTRESTALMTTEVAPTLPLEDYEKVFDASAGMPLYVMEMVQSMGCTSSTVSTWMSPTKSKKPTLAPSKAARHRVEETIYFRLDKLSLVRQSALKAIAVAVSRGRRCTFAMVQYLLGQASALSASSSSVATLSPAGDSTVCAVLDLVRADGFLTAKAAGAGWGSSGGTVSVESSADLLTVELDFKIPLEQATIYGLIGDAQREYFHERTARYWKDAMASADARGDPIDFSVRLGDLLEKGFHWQQAGFWYRALNTFVRAAHVSNAARNARGVEQSLRLAYRVYQLLEHQVGPVTFPESCFHSTNKVAQCVYAGADPTTRPWERAEELAQSIKNAQRICSVQPSVAADMLRLHVLLGQMYLFTWDEFDRTQRTLLVAMIYCAVYAGFPPAARVAGGSIGDRGASDGPATFDYGDVLDSSVGAEWMFLKIATMLGLINKVVAVPLLPPQIQSWLPPDKQAQLVADVGKEGANVLTVLGGIVAAVRSLHHGVVNRARQAMEGILEAYDPPVLSALLVSKFGADFVPYAMALLGQALIAADDLPAGVLWWRRALACLQDVRDQFSTTVTIMVLLGSVRFVGEFYAITTVLGRLHDEGSATLDFNSMGRELSQLVQLWMELEMLSTSPLAEGEGSDGGTDGGTGPISGHEAKRRIDQFIDLTRSIGAATATSPDAVTALGTWNARDERVPGELRPGKGMFMEMHGFALERIYIEVACRLWPQADQQQAFLIDQLVQNCLDVLLSAPNSDYFETMAKGLNLTQALSHTLGTARSRNGVTSGVVYACVRERADQPLQSTITALGTHGCPQLAWMLASCARSMPMHASIRDEYEQLWSQTKETVANDVLKGDLALQERLWEVAQLVGVPNAVP